jgi:hypothetical protein
MTLVFDEADKKKMQSGSKSNISVVLKTLGQKNVSSFFNYSRPWKLSSNVRTKWGTLPADRQAVVRSWQRLLCASLNSVDR